ncbi:hypothetical protein J6590_093861 [Homalodisca vitripennis]|nr:hypothetical protein J6590_093861 [Homalodisca vitripennis]
MAGQAGRLQGQDRSAVTCPSSRHARRCLIWLSCDNRRTHYTAPLKISSKIEECRIDPPSITIMKAILEVFVRDVTSDKDVQRCVCLLYPYVGYTSVLLCLDNEMVSLRPLRRKNVYKLSHNTLLSVPDLGRKFCANMIDVLIPSQPSGVFLGILKRGLLPVWNQLTRRQVHNDGCLHRAKEKFVAKM